MFNSVLRPLNNQDHLMDIFFSHSKIRSEIGILFIILAVILVVFFAAEYIMQHPGAQHVITELGYPGIFLAAVVASFNTIAVPAASLVPLFTAAGLQLPFIIAALAFGTFTADCINFALGNWGSVVVEKRYPATYNHFQRLYTSHSIFIWPAVFLYAAFVPLSNQIIILPLAALGAPFRRLFPILLLAAFVNQGLIALGTQSLFAWFAQ